MFFGAGRKGKENNNACLLTTKYYVKFNIIIVMWLAKMECGDLKHMILLFDLRAMI